jgi:hypothetical protein
MVEFGVHQTSYCGKYYKLFTVVIMPLAAYFDSADNDVITAVKFFITLATDYSRFGQIIFGYFFFTRKHI